MRLLARGGTLVLLGLIALALGLDVIGGPLLALGAILLVARVAVGPARGRVTPRMR